MAAVPLNRASTTSFLAASSDAAKHRECVEVRDTDALIAPAEKIIAAEHHVPEGAGHCLHERMVLPWLIGGMGVLGVAAVGGSLFLIDGWRAAALGVVWVLLGYAVAWSVVWGAGLFRAADEKHVEERIIHDEEMSRRV